MLLFEKNIGGDRLLPKISDDEINRLLQQYPKLKEFYISKVIENGNINKQKMEKFWEDFIKKQKEKDTEIVGGKNPIYIWESIGGTASKQAITIIPNQMEIENESKKEEINLGEADLLRNLDLKLDLVDISLTQVRTEQSDNKSLEKAIKRFQNHALNVLGGLKPSKFLKESNNDIDSEEFQEIITDKRDSFHGVIKDGYSNNVNSGVIGKIGKNMLNSVPKTLEKANQSVKDNIINSNYNKFKQNFEDLIKDNSDNIEKEREKHKMNMISTNNFKIFKELYGSANSRKLDTHHEYMKKYQEYHERANTILRLYYALILSEDFIIDKINLDKLDKMAQLINKLKGEINNYYEKMLHDKKDDKEREKLKEFERILNTIQEPLDKALEYKKETFMSIKH